MQTLGYHGKTCLKYVITMYIVVAFRLVPRGPEFDHRLLQSAIRDPKSWPGLHITY